jgi:hypothetical protein
MLASFDRLGRVLLGLAFAGAVGTSCSDEPKVTTEKPLTIPQGCNPIAYDVDGAPAADCLLPYPSDYFLASGAVRIPDVALPKFGASPIDLLAPHRPDGFSVGTPILALFPGGVDAKNLVFHTGDVSQSTSDASPTVLVDATTGERVAHFAELDPRAETDDRRALVLHPMARLENAHRYVVGIRGLVDQRGAPIPAPAAFASLRDDHGKAHPALAALSSHYESDVFPVLEGAGVPRASLELAWDFTTSTEESATGTMLEIQRDVAAHLAAGPPEIDVVSVTDAPSTHVGRRIDATVTVPLYVDSAEPLARLNDDGTGHVVARGTAKVPFSMWIPTSVMNRAPGTAPARLMQFGHGFFGTRDEVDDFPAELADEKGFVVVAADWWGLSAPDKLPVAGVIVNDPAGLAYVPDRVEQAMANFMYVAAAAKGPLSTMGPVMVNGAPAYDPSDVYYYGISLGHILGSTYVSLSPHVERAALSVGGCDFSLIMFRSQAFIPLMTLIALQVKDPLDQQKLVAQMQSALDRIDPVSYAPHMLKDRYPTASPSLRIAMQTGLGDPAVPNLASFMQARTLGVHLLEPSPKEIWGIDGVMSPQKTGSSITLFDFGVTPNDLAVAPLDQNPVHEGVRRSQGSKDQVDRFLRPQGDLVQACTGVCDPD